ncbi:MAG: tRNA lysidine(34) synthetase TilS [Anaerolineae bacterium]
MDLRARVGAAIQQYGLLSSGETVVVGVSGGVDSLCLLSLLRELAPEQSVSLHVGHLNHLLREEAFDEAARVQALCAAWSIPCTIGAVDARALAQSERLSLEEAARKARYRYLGTLAREVGAHSVAVGHQADDQAETVLMHLLRGAGLSGLRGMRPLAWLDEEGIGPESAGLEQGVRRVRLIRPLLGVWRRELQAYADATGLEPVSDVSNSDPAFFRNRLRHELLPFLETYNPRIREVLCRTAEALASDQELRERAVQEAWERTVLDSDPAVVLYDRARLTSEGQAMQRALLRQGVRQLRSSLRDLSWSHVAGAVAVLRAGKVGAKAMLPGDLMLTLGYDRALLAETAVGWPSADRPRLGVELSLTIPGVFTFPDGRWRVVSELVDRSSLPADWPARPAAYHAWLDADRLVMPLRLRPRRSGDRLVPLGMQGSQSVKELMIDCKVPAQERDTLPILECRAGLVWVVGLRIDGGYAIRDDTVNVLHIWLDPQAPGEEEQ